MSEYLSPEEVYFPIVPFEDGASILVSFPELEEGREVEGTVSLIPGPN